MFAIPRRLRGPALLALGTQYEGSGCDGDDD